MTFYLDKRQLSRVSLHMPRYGVAVATLETADPTAVTIDAPATLTLGDLVLAGTVVEGGATGGGTYRYDWRAGAGLWHREIRERAYQSGLGVLLSTVLRDLPAAFTEAGYPRAEQIAIGVPDRRLGPSVSHWTRIRGAAWNTLGATEVPWYVDPAGVTQIRERNGVEVTADDYTVTDNAVDDGRIRISLTGVRVSPWLPGGLVGGRPIRTLDVDAREAEPIRLTLNLGREEPRSLLDTWYEQRAAILAYHGTYEYIVRTRDGVLYGLAPVDQNLGLPELTGVELWTGIPASGADIKPGRSVLIGFIDGKPSRPVMRGFMPLHRDGSQPSETRLDADLVKLGAAQKLVAREDDTVSSLHAILLVNTPSSGMTTLRLHNGVGSAIDITWPAALAPTLTPGTGLKFTIDTPSQNKVMA